MIETYTNNTELSQIVSDCCETCFVSPSNVVGFPDPHEGLCQAERDGWIQNDYGILFCDLCAKNFVKNVEKAHEQAHRENVARELLMPVAA